jgi:serine/threonine-protein kinase HipA
MDNNQLDLDLVKQVDIYFRLGEKEMNAIIDQVRLAAAE